MHSSRTWTANSRVGTSTSAWVPGVLRARFEPFEDRDAEGGRLARARLRLAHQVDALEGLGISPAWIGVGSRYSASSSAASMTFDSPMAAKPLTAFAGAFSAAFAGAFSETLAALFPKAVPVPFPRALPGSVLLALAGFFPPPLPNFSEGLAAASSEGAVGVLSAGLAGPVSAGFARGLLERLAGPFSAVVTDSLAGPFSVAVADSLTGAFSAGLAGVFSRTLGGDLGGGGGERRQEHWPAPCWRHRPQGVVYDVGVLNCVLARW